MTSTGTTTAPAAMAAGDWLIILEPRPEAHLRLFCAHHAGGSAQYFDPWPASFSWFLPKSGRFRPLDASDLCLAVAGEPV